MNRRQRYLAALRDYRARLRYHVTRMVVYPLDAAGRPAGPGWEVEGVSVVRLDESA